MLKIASGQTGLSDRSLTEIIPYSRQWINDSDIDEVVKVLKSDWITQGPAIQQFERAVAEYCGAEYAVAVSNGSAALHIACLAAGLGSDGILWTSPNTFVASANCALYCGARPDFVDIDPRTYNMDVDILESKLEKADKNGSLPKVLVPVHFAGQSCDMERIHNLGKKYNFTIIEDACHAIGGRYKGDRIGSCKFSDMTVFSFHPVKTITSGEGGMVLTNSEELYHRLVRLRTHGITNDSRFMENGSEGPWYYQQIELGMNYRITDIQAALGLSQLRRIDDFVLRRNELADRYKKLSTLPLHLPYRSPYAYSAFHLYVVRLQTGKINRSRREVFAELHRRGIRVNVHYIPVHTQPYYRKLGFSKGRFIESEKYYEEAVTIPLFPSLTDDMQDHVIEIIAGVLS